MIQQAIQNAINKTSISGELVIIPRSEKRYNIYRALRVKKGVKILSALSKINRKFLGQSVDGQSS